jgi:UrcA family protein
MNRKLVALIAAGFAFVGSAAHAAPDTTSREATVRFADLNLETQAGIETLYSRLNGAARRVCGTADRGDLQAFDDMKQCRRKSIDDAVARIGNKALTARHAGSSDARYASNGIAPRS